MKKIVLCTAAAALLALASCQSLGMRDQTIAYNEAVADSTNQFFLLNVLRARDRFPIYYTRTTGNNAAESISPGVSLALSDQHLSPTLTANFSGSNTVTLQNLDDQKFMRGVLTPVPLSVLDAYLGQGWPKEVVLMMFIKKIDIDTHLAAAIADAFARLCDKNPSTDYCNGTLPVSDLAAEMPKAFAKLCADNPSTDYCVKLCADNPPTDYCVKLCADNPPTGYCGSKLPKKTDQQEQNSYQNSKPPRPILAQLALACAPSPDGKTYVFDNYPPGGREQVGCFKAMLRTLIALGLAPASASKFTVIAKDLEQSDIGALQGLGDATTAKLSISLLSGRKYAACTKSDQSGFTLDPNIVGDDDDDKNDSFKQIPTGLPNAPTGSPKNEQSLSELLAGASNSSAQLAAAAAPPPPNGIPGGGVSILGAALPSSCADQVKYDVSAKENDDSCKAKKKAKKDDPRCQKPTFHFATRSLDSMIYYLGEIVRAEYDITGKYKLQVWTGHETGQFESQTLFLVQPSGMFADAAVHATYRGIEYSIPDSCFDHGDCAKHRSLQVLSLLNQVWGLQKEATETPSVPVVSVINSH